MKTKKRIELHPIGEGIFTIVKLISNETKWTLIFAPLLKGYQPILRTYSIFKEADLVALKDLECDVSQPKKIKKHLQNYEGKTVYALVSKARNEGFRNIDTFTVIESETLMRSKSDSYINSTT